MRILVVVLIMSSIFGRSFSQTIKNDFFPLHNIIRGDSTYNTFDKQVVLVKDAGYNGIEINGVDNFEGMKAALDKNSFPASYFYVKITLDTPYIDKRLENYIGQLKGSNTIIAPFIVTNSKFGPGDHKADSLILRILQQLTDWSKKSGLDVAIYPHFGFLVETTDHALALVKSIKRKNLGLSFNLCHWLATTQLEERTKLKSHLRELKPYLKMITVCGANNTKTQQANVWEDYILPLGTGSFDTYGLLKYCLRDLKVKTPIGVQCYNIKTDKYKLVYNTMAVWNEYKQRLESGK